MTIDTQQALASSRELVLKHKLPLKILKCASDEGGLHFAYLCPEKTDLRPLSRDLNRSFKVKIHLEELAAEEAAGLIPGYGRCGTRLCWATDACENLWPCKFKEGVEDQTEENPQGLPAEEDPKGLRRQSLRVEDTDEKQQSRVGESVAISENQLKTSDHPRARKKLVRRLVLK